ncbi:MAG: hypothetical protein QOD74_944, partial [Variibacter sp.]|nr:hypothetical protein [Variibacter sp.]
MNKAVSQEELFSHEELLRVSMPPGRTTAPRVNWGRMISVGLLCGFAVAALAIAYIVLTPPRYYSSTEVLLDPRGLQVMKNDVAPRSETNDSAFAVIESEARVVQSEPVLQAVVERLKLED